MAIMHVMQAKQSSMGSMRDRLIEVARSLELYAAPATLTDRLNRLVHVNRAYAESVGDPNRDGLPVADRFLPSAMLGPYRDSFPGIEHAVAACYSTLLHEADRGRLDAGLRTLLEATLDDHPRVAKHLDGAGRWDGLLEFRDQRGRVVTRREHVIPVAGPDGLPSGFHIDLWVEAERSGAPEEAAPDIMALTPRQREIARLVVAGLTARGVAERLGLSHRTVRSHLEAIHARLDVHSRAELAALLVREGIA